MIPNHLVDVRFILRGQIRGVRCTMTKIYVYEDEAYLSYIARKPSDAFEAIVIEASDEKIKEWEEASEKFYKMQAEINELKRTKLNELVRSNS